MANPDTSFGVVYTPASVGPAAGQQKASVSDATLDQLGVRYIRLTWVDWTNTTRYHVLTRSYFRKLLRSSRPGITVTAAAFGIVFLHVCDGFSVTGEYLFALDESSFRVCPYSPGHATIMGFFQNLVPQPVHGLEMLDDPRTQLARVERIAREKAGVAYLVGFESEFILLKSTSPPVAINNADYAVSQKLPAGSIEAKVLEEIADALQDAGIEVQKYHGEAAPGQYEMITGPLPPLQAADACVATRETIFNVAAKHGLRATFAPRIHAYSAGTAAHVHMSVHDLGTHPEPARARGDEARAPALRATERSFLQGVVAQLPALCALTLPTAFSYGRVHDGIWSGGTYAAWGTENREAPVRVCGSAGNRHLEARFVDGTACPHLALAGILGAGTRAIAERALLETGDCAKSVATMTEEERAAAGVSDAARLGPTLGDARKAFKGSSVMREVFGDDFVDKYSLVNKTAEELFVADTEEETVTKLVNYY
ncbi:glutamine synthetase/guanido kinase [Phanerochaete sordida]|uniref:Glutamine synthetase/guanido kinase n=1 Tax=Phanerochaete sordida TaxID=48140 RepID=A0A9P3GER4_9APHY|nr:glutamine synthetase/guanido kinase [Phanerochaete sordida]